MLPVHERFYTFQGEGVHSGRPAFFVRLFGCPLHCPWCDSAGTWHKDYVPEHIHKMTEAEIVSEILNTPAPFVVITGGEPAIHDLFELTAELAEARRHVHLETSGAFPIKGTFDWITLSPKKWHMPLVENVRLASEFKIIVESPEDIGFYLEHLQANLYPHQRPVVWLHPEWSHRNDPAVLNAITEAVKARWAVTQEGGQSYSWDLRAGYQLHKLYRADNLDNRSAKQVPLGGDPSKGF